MEHTFQIHQTQGRIHSPAAASQQHSITYWGLIILLSFESAFRIGLQVSGDNMDIDPLVYPRAC